MVDPTLLSGGMDVVESEGNVASWRGRRRWGDAVVRIERGRLAVADFPGSARSDATRSSRTEGPVRGQPAAVRAGQGGAGFAPHLRSRFHRHRRLLAPIERAAL